METTNEAVNCTEYKIGNTTYYVETHFNLQAESLDEIIEIKKLTPEIMHELIEKIVVHAPDKSSDRRKQKIEIHFRFHVATSIAVADSMDYDKKRKAA